METSLFYSKTKIGYDLNKS